MTMKFKKLKIAGLLLLSSTSFNTMADEICVAEWSNVYTATIAYNNSNVWNRLHRYIGMVSAVNAYNACISASIPSE